MSCAEALVRLDVEWEDYVNTLTLYALCLTPQMLNYGEQLREEATEVVEMCRCTHEDCQGIFPTPTDQVGSLHSV